jgi:septum site-determining protein MinD
MADESLVFSLERLVDSQPTGYEISRTLSTSNPDVVLLEIADTDRDIVYSEAIHMAAPTLPIVAIAAVDISRALVLNPACGIVEALVWPFTVLDFELALERAIHKVCDPHHSSLVAFLPGKAGSGASTTVMNACGMLAVHLKKRPLVIEGDLHSGVFSTILNAKSVRSVRHALHDARTLELPDWERYLVRACGVDYLVTDTDLKEPVPSWADYYQLLRFVLPRYDMVLVDLPEVVNSATAEPVRTASAVYVITTPELPSLALSRQRCRELLHWGVEDRRLFVILTRWHKHDLAADDVEKILQHPVAAIIRNDYQVVQRAITEGKPLNPEEGAGADYMTLARLLAGESPVQEKPKPSRFSFLRA